MNIFTFWEGPMPGYIQLCMYRWKIPFTLLNYENLHKYTDLDIDKIKRFTLPQISDIVRVHVLRDCGGYWLDADTVLLTGQLPNTEMVGDPEARTVSAGLLYSEANSKMTVEWAEHQDEIINGSSTPKHWATFANAFCDSYVKEHEEIRIHPIIDYMPEKYMMRNDLPHYQQFNEFYFSNSFSLKDIRKTDLLMLHNSWMPFWFKELTPSEVLMQSCTLSNILREAH